MILTSLVSQRAFLAVVCIAVAVSGCSKKKEVSPSASDAAAVEASGAASAAPANQAVAAPSSVDTTRILNEADAALKAKDYQKAVEAALAAQRQQALTEQQAAARRIQMLQLQKDLANAIANGDAKAKAAADLLRRSASGAQ
jgi:predicted component of type VI protein secretion system